MTNAEKEFCRQFAWSLVRKGLAVLGGFLATHGWISADQADGLTAAAAVEFIASFLLLTGSSLWSYAKVRFNIGVVREARSSPENTSIGVITTETLDKSNATLISSV